MIFISCNMKGRKPIIFDNIQGIPGFGKNSFHAAVNRWQKRFKKNWMSERLN